MRRNSEAVSWHRKDRLEKRRRSGLAIIGSAIGRIRKQRGLTVKELASSVGVRQKTMRGIERGTEDPSLEQLVSTARALRCTAATLVEDIEPVEHDSTPPVDLGVQRPLPECADVELEEDANAAQRFGASLRAYRRANVRRPLDRVARDAGVPHTTFAFIERGGFTPRTGLAIQLADACGVRLSRLLGDAGL